MSFRPSHLAILAREGRVPTVVGYAGEPLPAPASHCT